MVPSLRQQADEKQATLHSSLSTSAQISPMSGGGSRRMLAL